MPAVPPFTLGDIRPRRLTVYIGRFSPFHKGHMEVLGRALKLSDDVLVIVGSADQAPTVKNPWTFDERRRMISAAVKDWLDVEYEGDLDEAKRILTKLRVVKARDFPHNDQLWLEQIQGLISESLPTQTVHITGADRDESTYYLKLFPKPRYQLDLVEENVEVTKFLTATSIRQLYFSKQLNGRAVSQAELELFLDAFVSCGVKAQLLNFQATDTYELLVRQQLALDKYKRDYGPGPFVTADMMVVQAGHVLLVTRKKGAFGEGLWALPGGFVNPNETIRTAALRELEEETNIKVPRIVINGNIQAEQVFDQPGRDLRARIITTCFVAELPAVAPGGSTDLPKVKGGDDAGHAEWVPLGVALDHPERFFGDHHAVIGTMLRRLRQPRIS